jgi:hypothetical protein
VQFDYKSICFKQCLHYFQSLPGCLLNTNWVAALVETTAARGLQVTEMGFELRLMIFSHHIVILFSE